jgi:hypothetical protein
MKRLLLGTGNPAKIQRIRAFLAGLPLEVVSPQDLGLALDVPEDGIGVEENAAKKARAYYVASGLPVLANDASLYIASLPPEKQPGLLVRRVRGPGQDVAGADVLDYYARELRAAGGASPGTWHVALALVTAGGALVRETFVLHALFVPEPSPVRLPGEPLSALMRDAATGRCYAEMGDAERPDAAPIRGFVARHLAEL